MSEASQDPQSWNSTNLIGLPVGLIASVEFNQHPKPLTIAGVRESNRGLFRLLEEADSKIAARAIFHHYMKISFGLHPLTKDITGSERHRFHASYIKLLEGWGFDSNSTQGAVLKGWVESRFGLSPTFHKSALRRFPSAGWMQYLEEKFSSRFHNNCIYSQIDILYEYCQWFIRRFEYPNKTHLQLWRGVNRYDEQTPILGQLKKGECLLKFSNLVSFTTMRERADEFGDWILEAQVPLAKIIYFPGLLSGSTLTGENEVIALGGHYCVKAQYV